MLIKELQARANTLAEAADKMDIPSHIIDALVTDLTKALSGTSKKNPKQAAFDVVAKADLAGLDDDDSINVVASMVLKQSGHVKK